MKSAPLSASRQASVAMSRARTTSRAAILSRQMRSASMVRSMAPSLRTVAVARAPRPSRTMRENASTTRNPKVGGLGDEEAAIVGAEIEGGVGVAARPALRLAAARSGPARGPVRRHYDRRRGKAVGSLRKGFLLIRHGVTLAPGRGSRASASGETSNRSALLQRPVPAISPGHPETARAQAPRRLAGRQQAYSAAACACRRSPRARSLFRAAR